MPGRAWDLVARNDVDEALRQWLSLGLFHIHTTSTPNSTIVRIHQEGTGEQISLDKPCRKHQLVLVPCGKKFLTKKAQTVHTFVPLEYAAKGSTNSSKLFVSSEGCGDFLFWKLIGNSDYQPQGPTTLSWVTTKMEVSIKAAKIGAKGPSGLTRASPSKSMVITFPYLTNESDLPERAYLTVPRIVPSL